MAEAELGTIIAERILQSPKVDKQVRVRIGCPQITLGENFITPYQIIGVSDEKVRFAAGLDAVQSLQLVLQMIGADIHYRLKEYHLHWADRAILVSRRRKSCIKWRRKWVGILRMDIRDLQRKAASGNVAAQSILGICYLDGTEVEVNYQEAFRLLSAAAQEGAPRALANLARMYAEGLGIPRNLPEAIRLFEGAANAGEFFAQIELARIYAQGRDVPVDPRSAFRWYSAAATQAEKVGDCEELREATAYIASAT